MKGYDQHIYMYSIFLTLELLCLFQTLKLLHHYQMKHLGPQALQPFQTPLLLLKP